MKERGGNCLGCGNPVWDESYCNECADSSCTQGEKNEEADG